MPSKKPPEERPIETCGNCLHFRRHYTRYRNERGYHALTFGHCVHPRLKPRFCENTCPHFTPRIPDFDKK